MGSGTGFGEGFSRVIIVIVNSIFAILGLTALGCGIAFKLEWDDFKDAFEDADTSLKHGGQTLGISLIVIGCIMFGIAIMGCIGGWCEVKPLLLVYAIAVIIILLAQIVIVAVVASNLDESEETLIEEMRKSLKGYDEALGDDKSKAWSAIFDRFDCCGAVGPNDFFLTDMNIKWNSQFRNPPTPPANSTVPIACCEGFDYEDDEQTQALFTKYHQCVYKASDFYKEGCETKFSDFVDDNKEILIGVGIAIMILEAILIAMALFLFCRD